MSTYLVHAPINIRAFCRWAGERGLMKRGSFDRGFALHVLLSGMFGKGVLQPLRLFASARNPKGSLYAYAASDADGLRHVADAVATPDCLEVLRPDRMRTKLMPVLFSSGQRLGFDVHVRPVRRLLSDLADAQSGRVLKKGAEVDSYRLQLLRSSPGGWAKQGRSRPLSDSRERRCDAYVAWLAERLATAAAIEACRLAGFRRSRLVRGNGVGPEGPDATLHGVLTVKNPEVFARVLRRGVGRHKAYGYGMLLLRPPDLR